MPALTERGVSDPAITRSLDAVTAATDADQVLRAIAGGTCETARRQLRAISVLCDSVHADPLIADAARRADLPYRERLDQAALRLAEFGAVRAGVDQAEASDVLWFFFGRISWRHLHEMGWNWPRAERWLLARATSALCGDGH